MEVDEKRNTKEFSNEQKLLNKLMFVCGGVLVIIFLGMTTCTMHSNGYDSERIKEGAVALQAKYAMQTATSAHRLEKIKAIERMIKNGANPVAAACAIHGWDNDDIACIVAAGRIPKKND